MDSSKYIGRVGALAVALGIGTALTSGTGVAWADDGGNTSGKANSSASSDAGKSGESAAKEPDSKPSTTTKPDRKGPLSKVGERIRKDVEAGLDGVQDALKRSQTRIEKTRDELRDRPTKVTAVTADAEADEDAVKPTRKRRDVSVDKAETTVPTAANAVPALDRAQRPNSVVVKVKEATQDITERISETVSATRAESVVEKVTQRSVDAPATAQAANADAAPARAVPVVSALLAAAGLSPLAAGTSPVAPAQSPGLWAVMAWARREFERAVNPSGTSLVSANDAASVVAEGEIQPTAATAPNLAVQTDDLTPKPEVPASLTGATIKLPWVTGTGVTDHWYVAGTDLGIMWNSGYTDPETGKPIIYTLFGDTYSGPNMTGDWRNNVLFRTSDTNLMDGLQFSDALIHAGASPTNPGIPRWYSRDEQPAAGAAQIIYDPGYDGLFGRTYTMIPTSAIAIQNDDGTYTQYATVMSIRTWDNPGSWTTNYSAIAYSTDEGKTWTVDRDTVRSSGWLRAGPAYVPGDEHFQQNALVMSNDPQDPYVYVYGTPSGRQGSAYLARVEKDQIMNLDAYEYWAGEDSSGTGQWTTGDPSAAVAVFGSSETDFLPRLYKVIDTFTFGFFSKIANGIWVGGLPTGGNVSEMSVQYNEYLGQYVVLYTDGGNNVVMRVSESPQGEWSDTTTLVRNDLVTNTGMYAPMVHPMSGTDYFDTATQDNSQYLYYNLSYWGEYNVRLMRTDLESMKTISV
ncbi:hypothetical protein AFM11_26920 [Mycolicibacterium wolinskyi]|uniref:DUF4185 domain-containing protein n=1 Tax=Mycolicibacterium wolinskyi TaxID=59750 RepID=A0A132PG98_9MYCO|nr:DUF4185 domain-containing protein [Mycolicibacterium wolinskyi]KWX21022.1 hypothetical protein AFM11_26920 [Mycolicibacterium wolinskyi]